jgi:CSLREA domain-containing protein
MNGTSRQSPITLAPVLAIVLLSVPSPTPAATINVNTTLDQTTIDGNCSLREAINVAINDLCVTGQDCSCGVGTDTIKLPAGTYNVSSALEITGDSDNLLIRPQSDTAKPTDVILDANLSDRIFHVHDNPGTVVFARLTLRDGRVYFPRDPFLSGGCLWVDNATASLDTCMVENCVSESGAGASVKGGASLAEEGKLYVHYSTFYGNQALSEDGGSAEGGAISVGNYGVAEIYNSTLTSNVAASSGGAIVLGGYAVAKLKHATITDNFCGFDSGLSGSGCGVYLEPGSTVDLSHTILAGNKDFDTTSPDYVDCFQEVGTTVTSYGYNLVGDATGCTISLNFGDHLGITASPVDPDLSSLYRNAEGTLSYVPSLDSLAVEGGSIVTGNDFQDCDGGPDQRGVNRPVDAPGGLANNCDIGAVETVPIFVHGFEAGSTIGWSDEVP